MSDSNEHPTTSPEPASSTPGIEGPTESAQNDGSQNSGAAGNHGAAGTEPVQNQAPAFPAYVAPTAPTAPTTPVAPSAPAAPASHVPPAPAWQAPSQQAPNQHVAPQAQAPQAHLGQQQPPYGQPQYGQPAHTAPTAPIGGPARHPGYPQFSQTAQTAPTANYGNGAFGQPPQQPPVAGAAGSGGAAPSKKRGGVVLVAALAVGALLGGASGAGISVWALSQNNGGNSPSASSPSTITVNDPDDATLATAVAAKASPSVVTISVASDQSGGTGSGVILSADGYILTNTHVVTLDGETASPTIQVTTNDGRLFTAKVVGTDPVADLAVIKLDNASGLTPIAWGDSTKLNVGDSVVAIGAPLGLAGTVTTGIVSALNRSISVASSAAPKGDDSTAPDQGDGGQGDGGQGGDGSPFDFWNFDNPDQGGGGQQEQQQPQQQPASSISLSVIQTDAAINPGNSGGALLNSKGELIGINVAIASAGSSASGEQSGSIGVGFSIPAAFAQRISEEIIKTGTGSHGLLGASVGDASSDSKLASVVAGALVKDVTSGGAAEKAGLKAGDVITAFNGIAVTDATDLTAEVRSLAAGASAKLTVYRDGNSSEIDVTLGELVQ